MKDIEAEALEDYEFLGRFRTTAIPPGGATMPNTGHGAATRAAVDHGCVWALESLKDMSHT